LTVVLIRLRQTLGQPQIYLGVCGLIISKERTSLLDLP